MQPFPFLLILNHVQEKMQENLDLQTVCIGFSAPSGEHAPALVDAIQNWSEGVPSFLDGNGSRVGTCTVRHVISFLSAIFDGLDICDSPLITAGASIIARHWSLKRTALQEVIGQHKQTRKSDLSRDVLSQRTASHAKGLQDLLILLVLAAAAVRWQELARDELKESWREKFTVDSSCSRSRNWWLGQPRHRRDVSTFTAGQDDVQARSQKPNQWSGFSHD